MTGLDLKKGIVLICDDNYVIPTAVTIKSIIENSKVENGGILNIYVCALDIQQKDCDFLISLSTTQVNVKILSFRKEDFKDKINKIQQKTHVTPASLIKFDLPNLLENLDTVIYLDSDIIVKNDICELFDLALKDNYVAASPELWKIINMKWNGKNSCSGNDGFYFNSGVMLMNLYLMRKDNTSEILWRTKLKLIDDRESVTMDQDALNIVLGNKALPLSIRWNLNTYFTENIDLDLVNEVCKEHFRTLDELKSSACILHYVGKEDKPWKYLTAHCRETWDYYYKKCGFDFNELNRTSINKGLRWKIMVLHNILKTAGVQGVFRFLKDKIEDRGFFRFGKIKH